MEFVPLHRISKQYVQQHNSISDWEVREAIDHALSQMPPHLRLICERLKYDSINKIAKDLGISRYQVYKAIKEVRYYFREAGLP